MSRVSKNNSSNVTGWSGVREKHVSMTNTPFCKHCVNLNLDTNHWLYSNGTLVCPVLKNTECTNCHKKGHTKSRCAARPASSKERISLPAIEKTPMSIVLRNRYDAFLVEEIEEEQRVEKHYKQFPVLAKTKTVEDEDSENKTEFSTKPSYSAILKTVAPAPSAAATPSVSVSKVVDPNPTSYSDLADYVKMNGLISIKKKSWADYSDSESECDDDEYFEK